jgi:hydrogenase maturation protease
MLVAGVGNIFLSDDGFGSEVVRHMCGVPVPADVDVVDIGIRGVHLAYQLLDGYDVLVIVDAAARGQAPGTVTLLTVDQALVTDSRPAVADGESALVDAHGLAPGAILSMLAGLGGAVRQVYVVACEPVSVEEGIGLSPAVQGAIGAAIALVEQLMWSGAVPGTTSQHAEEVSR